MTRATAATGHIIVLILTLLLHGTSTSREHPRLILTSTGGLERCAARCTLIALKEDDAPASIARRKIAAIMVKLDG